MFQIYFYGPKSPWRENVIPYPGLAEGKLIGAGCHYCGIFNFYSMFCGNGSGGSTKTPVSAGNKPFIITETGAAFHISDSSNGAPIDPGPGRLAMKQAWWRQVLNSTFQSTYPKVKAYCSFEMEKTEEATLRDFSILGPVPHALSPDEQDKVAQAFRNDISGSFAQTGVQLRWASVFEIPKNTTATPISISIQIQTKNPAAPTNTINSASTLEFSLILHVILSIFVYTVRM